PPVPGLGLHVVTSTPSALDLSGTSDLSRVHTVPDPYYVANALEITANQKVLKFVNLPSQCIIRIYSVSGVLVGVIPFDDPTGGGPSGEFRLLGAGARGAALGGAYAALATDVTALYYNPGGLAQLPRPGAMVSTYDYVAGTRYSWLGIAFPLTGGARSVG